MSKTLKFNAGKVQYDEETRRCTPLPNKGSVLIKQSSEDEEMYDFIWAPKSGSGSIEKDELLIIPGDVSFKPVKSCKTGRVLALTFLSSGAKHLYWLQDVGEDDELSKFTPKDEAIIKDVNEIISIPEYDGETERDTEGGPKVEETGVEMKVMYSILAPHINFSTRRQKEENTVKIPMQSINDVMDMDTIDKHLNSLSREQLKTLYGPYLPKSIHLKPTKKDIIEVLRNGFFQQSIKSLSDLLSNGAGFTLSQILKYEYSDEGVEGFLAGVRQLSKRQLEDLHSKPSE